MAVIAITVTESPIQIISGIPQSVSFETNIPSTVFYTLDGTDPTVNSDIAIGTVYLPTNIPTLTLKVFATNGVDYSTVIEFVYKTVWQNDRRPRDTVINAGSDCSSDPTPKQFTISSPNPNAIYGNTAGIIVDAPDTVGEPLGYGADGYVVSETDKPYHRWNYDIVYDTTDNKGLTGHGIGNLPAKTSTYNPINHTNSNKVNSLLFNPKSMVIIQDGREVQEDDNVSFINRQFFSLGNAEKERDGATYSISAFEGANLTGTFLKPYYNQKDNTYTFYYRDFNTNRWIISIEPASKIFGNKPSPIGNLLPPSTFAQKKVFKWIPFSRRSLR